MKTKLLLLVAFLVAMALPGCKKDEAPVSSDKPINITTNPNGDTSINPGSTITINYEITGDVTMSGIKIDGVTVSTSSGKSGEYTLENVTTNKTCVVFYQNLAGKLIDGKQVKVTVKEAAIQTPVIVYFTADPIVVLQGKSVKLKWSAKFALDSTKISAIPATLPRLVIDSVDSLVVVPLESTVYTLTCYNKGKSSSRDVAVTVILPPPPITFNERLKADWSKTDVLYKPKDSTQYASRLKPCDVDDHWKFDHGSDTTVGTFEMHQGALRCLAGDELWASGGYFLISNNTQIVIGGLVYDIVLITDTQLILRFDDIGMVGAKYEFVFQKLQKK